MQKEMQKAKKQNLNNFNGNNKCDNDFDLNKKQIKFAFGLFSENTINFIYLDKNTSEIKINKIHDVFDPFCPLPEDVFFMNFDLLCKQTFYDYLNDKLINFIQANSITNTSNNLIYANSGSAFTASIYAGIDSYKNIRKKGFYHMHVFCANKNSNGIGFFPEAEYIKKYSSENEIKLFLPENNIANNLLEKLLQNDITLNLFVCGLTQANYLDFQINLPTFFSVCSKTGGRGFYYSIINKHEKFNEDIKTNYQKLHYDLNSILNKKYYYDVEIQLINSSEFLISDIFYSVGNSNQNKIKLPSINNDFNMIYHLKFSKTLKEEKKYSFQFTVSYIDPQYDNSRKIRVFNYAIFPNEIYFKIYSYLDIDTMVKLIFSKEVADSLSEKNKNVCCFEKVKENLKKRLIDALFFYKKNVSKLIIKKYK